MSPFPFHKLPHLVLQNIFQSVDIEDIFCFALISSKTRFALRNAQVRVVSYDVQFEWHPRRERCFQMKFSDGRTYKVIIQDNGIYGYRLAYDAFRYVFDGMTTYLWKTTQNSIICELPRDRIPTESLCRLLRHMQRMLGGVIGEVSMLLELADGFWRNMFGTELINECRRLTLNDAVIEGSHMEFLLANVDIREALQVRVLQNPNSPLLINCVLLRIPHISLTDGTWFTPNHLLWLQSRTVFLESSNLDSKDFHNYIKYWMDSDNDTLEVLSVVLKDRQTAKVSDLLGDIPNRKWNRSVRDGVKKLTLSVRYGIVKYNEVCCEKGRDIERKDGTLATVLMFHKIAMFVVWKERFPNGQLVKDMQRQIEKKTRNIARMTETNQEMDEAIAKKRALIARMQDEVKEMARDSRKRKAECKAMREDVDKMQLQVNRMNTSHCN